MGGWSKAPQRHGAQTVGSGAKARIEGVGLSEACAIIFVLRSVMPTRFQAIPTSAYADRTTVEQLKWS